MSETRQRAPASNKVDVAECRGSRWFMCQRIARLRGDREEGEDAG